MHIDDPRSPEIKLPSLSKCMELTPSEILAKLLPKQEPEAEPEQEMEEPVQEEMTTLNDKMKDDIEILSDVEMEESADEEVKQHEGEERMEDDTGDEDDDMPPLEGEENAARIAVGFTLWVSHF